MNPLWPLFFAAFAFLSVLLITDCLTGRRWATQVIQGIMKFMPWILGGLIAFDVWRVIYLPI